MTKDLKHTYALATSTLQVQELTTKDIPDAMALIVTIKNSGCLAKPHHLKERTFEQFKNIVNNGYALLGIRNEQGQLIAFTSVAPTLGDEKSMTIRALSVHPDYMGQCLGKKCIQAAMQWTHDNFEQPLKARVSTDNQPSLASFSKLGFYPVNLAWDNDDKYWYYILAFKHSPSVNKISCYPHQKGYEFD